MKKRKKTEEALPNNKIKPGLLQSRTIKIIIYSLVGLWISAGTFAFVMPYEWIKVRAQMGDQHAVRFMIAQAAAEKNLDAFYKWNEFLNSDPLNYPYMRPEDREVIIKLRDALKQYGK